MTQKQKRRRDKQRRHHESRRLLSNIAVVTEEFEYDPCDCGGPMHNGFYVVHAAGKHPECEVQPWWRRAWSALRKH